MKVLTIPKDLKKLGSPILGSTSTRNRMIIEATTIVLAIVLILVFFGLLSMMEMTQPIGLVAGSLTTLLGVKPNRRKEVTPNFKTITNMGLGEKLPNRRQLQEQGEEHMWSKYPTRMFNRVMEVLS